MSCHRCNRLETAALVCFVAAFAPLCLVGEGAPFPVPLAAETIVEKLMVANTRRAQSLRGYRGRRSYRVDYHGFPGARDAEMEVEASYLAPNQKNFKILSQSGSKLLINHVLLKLLDSEKEATQEKSRRETELSPKNYAFALVETEHTANGDFYVLAVTPREKNKFLYRGKIWVDAQDFAVARMEGEPAKNPSFWISHTQIGYVWSKIGGFWLPAHNQSVTQVRMGGKAVLTIDYTDYQITGVKPAAVGQSSGKPPELPPPSAVSGDPH